jgi:hypothetical protein
MDALILAFITLHKIGDQEPVPAESQTFEPFDLQSLRSVYRTGERSAQQRARRNDSPLAQAVS